MDPLSILLAAGAASTAIGGGIKAVQEISDWVRKNKERKKLGDKPNLRNYPKGTVINRQGNGPYMISEPGKAPYEFAPAFSPIKFSDEAITQVDNLPPKERQLTNTLINLAQSDPQSFFGSLEKVDPEALQEAAQSPIPSAEQLGFPPSQNIIDQLMQQTDFGPIEDLARKQFQEKTIPSLTERFNALGSLPNRSLQAPIARAGAELESQLAALRSQYGLQRAGLLGNLQQKQQALDVGRAQTAGNLGLATQGQQFGQQQALANLGLQQNQQQLSEQQQRNALLSSLLGQGQYTTVGAPKNQTPGVADYLSGAGLSALGLAGQGYLQQQNTNNLLEQLKLLGNKGY